MDKFRSDIFLSGTTITFLRRLPAACLSGRQGGEKLFCVPLATALLPLCRGIVAGDRARRSCASPATSANESEREVDEDLAYIPNKTILKLISRKNGIAPLNLALRARDMGGDSRKEKSYAWWKIILCITFFDIHRKGFIVMVVNPRRKGVIHMARMHLGAQVAQI